MLNKYEEDKKASFYFIQKKIYLNAKRLLVVHSLATGKLPG